MQASRLLYVPMTTGTLILLLLVPSVIVPAMYAIAHQAAIDSPQERLQHVPAPAEYAELDNSFENAHDRYCVVLQETGPNADAVRAIVREAVPNRTDAWAAELMKRLPHELVESTDRDSAAAIAARLEEVGARAAFRPVLDEFLDLLNDDRDSPIGKPSQVLDPEWLRSGRDSIADARASKGDDREVLGRAYLAYTAAEGRALYQIYCRPCHGTAASGRGPMAAGFSLAPANFRDPNAIAALRPGEMLWRVEQGGPGLPREATPWDSSMPAWKHELDREIAWKIVFGEYSTADARPRAGHHGEHRHVQPAGSSVARILPDKSWLDWSVPPKPSTDQAADPTFVKRGQYIYYVRCMSCHGVAGAGDGPAANTMWPRPRDFTDITIAGFEDEKTPPKFKFRTTRQGWLPLDEDLYRTISRGLTGTAMEGWADVLKPDEIWQVIAYLKNFSTAWNDPKHEARNPNDAVVVEKWSKLDGSGPIIDYAALRPPRVTADLIEQGKETFLRFRCFECHGFEARGDGPALGQHFDDWGYRTWPQNLANPFNYKAGHSMKDIYRTFVNSLDGTVMPVLLATTIDPQDAKRGERLQWALAAYVHSQVRSPQPARSAKRATREVSVQKAELQLPLDPSDDAWNRVRETEVPLSGQVITQLRWPVPSVNQVAVKALYNDDAIALWLRWDDRRPNVTHRDVPDDLEPQDPNPMGPKAYAFPALRRKSRQQEPPVVFDARDQLELQWPASVDPDSPPFFFYGDEKNPVVVWRWLADKQGLAVRKETVEIAGAKAERLECLPTDSNETAFVGAVVTLHAAGLQNLRTPDGAPPALVRSRAHWSNGAWTLVLSRALRTDGVDDIQFVTNSPETDAPSAGNRSRLAIHIWDGLAGETDFRMAISSWIDLKFVQPRPAWHIIASASMALAILAIVIVVVRRRRHFLKNKNLIRG